jgi:hypothetical protein
VYSQQQMVLLCNLKALLLLLLLLLVFLLVCEGRLWRRLCRLSSSGRLTGARRSWMLLHDSQPHRLLQQQQLQGVMLQPLVRNSRLCVI